MVTGESGSGKSTLVNDILFKGLSNKLNKTPFGAGKCREIRGAEYIDKIINIDQQPIGRTPRSNPATYVGVFSDIRELFSQTSEAKMRGYKPGRFSFNVKGGRCEACHGDGIIKIEMQFLSDVYVPCEVCHGARYNRETLEVHYKGKNIYDVLNMTVDEAIPFFENHPKILRKLETMQEVGLGYIHLGQPATTMSGGEAQRVKLATELMRRNTGDTLYILDEPTTGLDPNQIFGIRKIIKEIGEEKTVILSSHILSEIETTCDQVMIMSNGKIVANGTTSELRRKSDAEYCLKVGIKGGETSDIHKALDNLPGVLHIEIIHKQNFELQCKPDIEIEKSIFSLCQDNNWYISELTPVQTRLEDIFRKVTQNG